LKPAARHDTYRRSENFLEALSFHGTHCKDKDRLAPRPRPQACALARVSEARSRSSGGARSHGIETRLIDGVKVQITTPAKTVADCFRFRRHVGFDVALSALKDFLKSRKGSIDALVAAAQADRICAFMRPYLEALA